MKLKLLFVGLVVGVLVSLIVWLWPRGNEDESTTSNQSVVRTKDAVDTELALRTSDGGAALPAKKEPHVTTRSLPVMSRANLATVNAESRRDGTGFGEAVAHDGQAVQAVVTVGEQMQQLAPNQVGCFPRVYVAAKQVIPVSVRYPEAAPGATVIVQVEDGGELVEPSRTTGVDNDLVRVVKLDSQHVAQFTFRLSENQGTHRVVLRRGSDRKALDFWVGEDTTLAR